MARILVVDDSVMDRLLARRLLEKDPELIIAQAEHGADALKQMEEMVPDAVVTDLQMPSVDGLQLVEAIRRRFPYVPVVLMTAHGSEDIAAQALMAGAASYVPKAELPRHLLDTVQNVLAAGRTNRRKHDLMECLDARHFDVSLDNDVQLIPPLVDQLQQMAVSIGLVDNSSRVQLAVALEEALLNALYHGNLELSTTDVEEYRSALVADGRDRVAERGKESPYRERKIHVSVTLTRDEGRFVIRDDGLGFDTRKLPDPADPANLTREDGRGTVLINMFMDEVSRNLQGNELRLVKRRKCGSAESMTKE